MAKDFAVYKGDEFICLGTAKECAERLGVKEDTIRYYTSPSARKRNKKRKNPQECLIVIKLDDED